MRQNVDCCILSKVFGKIDTPAFSVMIEVRTIVEFLSLKLHFSAGFLPKSYDFFSRCMSHLQTRLLYISPTLHKDWPGKKVTIL